MKDKIINSLAEMFTKEVIRDFNDVERFLYNKVKERKIPEELYESFVDNSKKTVKMVAYERSIL